MRASNFKTALLTRLVTLCCFNSGRSSKTPNYITGSILHSDTLAFLVEQSVLTLGLPTGSGGLVVDSGD